MPRALTRGNSRDEYFTLTDSTTSGARNLHGVINHELGHLLGLSHTRERSALMRTFYDGTLEPAQDDTAGCRQTRTDPGRFGLWALGAGLLLLARGRRGRPGHTVL